MNLNKVLWCLGCYWVLAQNAADSLLKKYEYYLIHHPNEDSAAYYLRQALRYNHPLALYFAGVAYFRGHLGFSKNPYKGIRLLKAAADSGEVLAMVRLMEIYGDTSDPTFMDPIYVRLRNKRKAFYYARKAAERRYPQAVFYLAHAYKHGWGTQPNDSLALFWMRIAAESFLNPQAQLDLGNWYFFGQLQDSARLEKAKHYFEMVLNNYRASPEQQAWAKVRLHELRQMPLLMTNLIIDFIALQFHVPAGVWHRGRLR